MHVCKFVCVYVYMCMHTYFYDMHTFVYACMLVLEVRAWCLILSLLLLSLWDMVFHRTWSPVIWWDQLAQQESRILFCKPWGYRGALPLLLTWVLGVRSPHLCVEHFMNTLPTELSPQPLKSVTNPILKLYPGFLRFFFVKICFPLSDQYLSQIVPVLKLLCTHVSCDWQTNHRTLLSEIMISSFIPGPRCKFRQSKFKCSISGWLETAVGFWI